MSLFLGQPNHAVQWGSQEQTLSVNIIQSVTSSKLKLHILSLFLSLPLPLQPCAERNGIVSKSTPYKTQD